MDSAGDGEADGTEEAALGKLRTRLEDAVARSRLTKTQLAARADIGRTTLHQALRVGAPAPTAATVEALGVALGLSKAERKELSELRREGAGHATMPATGVRWGRPIDECDPHMLEVHPAGAPDASGPGSREPALSKYVPRAHDVRLAEVVDAAREGHSHMLVLVGSSSTGKTRACWEAVRPLAAEGWKLWHPNFPTRAEAALAGLPHVGPRTVVWLNEAQHYLGDERDGERIAAAVHSLLTDPDRAPVLVLGTLWREYADQYTVLPVPGESDRHSRTRELLAARTVPVPVSFDADALAAAEALARQGDRLLSEALRGDAGRGRIAQQLAGAPELLRCYEEGGPFASGLLQAAMDARRLGVGPRLAQAFLSDAATDYIAEEDWDDDPDGWAQAAFDELARRVHGKQAALRRVDMRPRRRPSGPQRRGVGTTVANPSGDSTFVLADFLEQHGRITRRQLCPPASFWHAAGTHLEDPADLGGLAEAARRMHRLHWAEHLLEPAARGGVPHAVYRLTRIYEKRSDRHAAQSVRQWGADAGCHFAWEELVDGKEEAGDRPGAEALARQAVGLGSPPDALTRLANKRAEAGEPREAEILYRQAVEAGDLTALVCLGQLRARTGNLDGAEAAWREAGEAGQVVAWFELGGLREHLGDQDGADALYRRAAEAGVESALVRLAKQRAQAGKYDEAEALLQRLSRPDAEIMLYQARLRRKAGDEEGEAFHARRAAEAGRPVTLVLLMRRHDREGNKEKAEALALQAAAARRPDFLEELVCNWETRGEREDAEELARRAADAGYPEALVEIARLREAAGDDRAAERFCQQASDAGAPLPMTLVAWRQWQAGDREEAEILADRAAAAGEPYALVQIAERYWEDGDHDRALSLYRRAAEAHPRGLTELALLWERRTPEAAEGLAHLMTAAGRPETLFHLAGAREKAGRDGEARRLYQAAVDASHSESIMRLARLREKAGETTAAHALYLRAANAGLASEAHERIWPYGLDPDGKPTPPWW